jgi:hypothetical protein
MITVHVPYDPNRVTTRAPIFGIRTNHPTNHPDSSPEILRKLEELGGKIEDVKDKQSAHASVLSQLQARPEPVIPQPPDVKGALEEMLCQIPKPHPPAPDNTYKIVDAVAALGITLGQQLRVFHERNTESFADMREFLSKNMPVQTPVVIQKPSRLPWLMCGAIVAIDLLGHIKW